MEDRRDATGGPAGDAPTGRSRWRRRAGRLVALVASAAVLVPAAGIALLWTQAGQELALRSGLRWLNARLVGRLSVAEVRSGSLLQGAVLSDVRLDAEGGAPVLTADSLELRYSVLGLLRGEPRLARVTAWGPRVRIAPVGDGSLNVARILQASGDVGARNGEPVFRIDWLSIRDGLLEVFAAGEDADEGGDGPGLVRRVALEQVEVALDDLAVRSPGPEVATGRLRALSTTVSALDEPIRLGDGHGALSYGEGGITVADGGFRLGDSPFAGTVRVGPAEPGGPWELTADVRTDGVGRLSDLAWVDPRLPRGAFRGGARVRAGRGVVLDLRSMSVSLDDSRLSLSGGVTMHENGRVSLRGLEAEASPLSLDDVQPWIDAELPWQGWLSGQVVLSGDVEAVRAEGRLTLLPTGTGQLPTTAEFDGTFHAGRRRGVTDLTADVAPLDYGVVADLLPALRLTGDGSAHVEASGDTERGFDFRADLVHRAGPFEDSRVTAEGSALRRAGRWTLEVAADLDSLALETFAGVAPAARLTGRVSGDVRARGPLDTLVVTGDLAAGRGRVTFEMELNATSPSSAYRLYAEGTDVALSALSASVPEETRWNGSLSARGSGLAIDSLEGGASLVAARSSVRGVPVDTAVATVRVSGGVLEVDTVEAVLSGVRVAGGGRIGLVAGMNRSARFTVEADSIESLRPLVMGENLIARDMLSDLERQRFMIAGVDPDTLPTSMEIRMAGALRALVELRGSLDSLDVDASLNLVSAAMGLNMVDSLAATVSARGLPSLDAAFDVTARADGVLLGEREFTFVRVEAGGARRSGEGSVEMVARPGERYSATGAFELLDGGGSVRLDEAAAELDSLVLSLSRPAQVAWDSSSVTVTGLVLGRSGPDPMTVTADGTLSRTVDSSFRLDVEGLHVERVARMAQLTDFPGEGHVDLSVSVSGPSTAPDVDALFQIQEPRYGDLTLTRIAGTMEYRSGRADLRLDAFSSDRVVFTASGELPLELTLSSAPRWRDGQPVDMRVVADSLDASVALAHLSTLEDVAGTISGDFRLGGTVEDLRPSGSMRLTGAAWSIEALGTRQQGVSGTLTLHADRTVDVYLTSSQPGFSEVTGTVTLEPLSNPGLDLTFQFRDFLAVSRRDIEAMISDTLRLTGTYRRPLVQGRLTVSRTTVFVDEFVRSADVVDLNDPRFDDLFEAMTFDAPSLVGDLQNPFMANLRVDVDLVVPQEAWLRSGTAGVGLNPARDEMNVEMGGELLVAYDRGEGDLVLVGALEALRGSYSIFGRTFDVEEGTVTFLGTPGINPTLDITAVTRVRGLEAQTHVITATVGGTLTQPRVALSADDQAMAETDIISYLVFGRPSGQLTTGEAQVAGGRFTAPGVAATALGVTGTFLTSALVNTYAPLFAQRLLPISVDYLSISQAGTGGLFLGGESGFRASTLVEVGRYLGRDIFVVFILRPTGEDAGAFGGARVEWAIDEDDTLELFLEERFLRSRSFVSNDLMDEHVLGFFVFRQWGY